MSNNPKYEDIKNVVAEDFVRLNFSISSLFDNQGTFVSEDLKNFILNKSKQLRSCLLFLFSHMLYGKVSDDVIKLAMAIEIIHNATLIHDDIIDDAIIRRNQQTIHHKYDNKLAIIAGDYLLTIAIKLLLELKKTEILEIFSTCLFNLCNGEIKQYFSKNMTTSIDAYLEKSQAKTSSLFSASLISLAMLNNDEKNADLLGAFADNFGLAFQIRDDLNNFSEDKENKPVLKDIENGIYTAPTIFAYGKDVDLSSYSVEDIVSISQKTENIKKTEMLIQKYKNLAINGLLPYSDSIYKSALLRLCNII